MTILLALLVGFFGSITSAQQKELIVVVGAAGEAEYGTVFSEWAERWRSATGEQRKVTLIGLEESETEDRERLATSLKMIAESSDQPELWVVLIGHGTFDGSVAKFNLKGNDFSATELSEWLKPIESQTVVINCSSCSSPFVTKLAAPNRIVLSATKSGYQYNFARFGDYISKSVNDATIDLDKDGQTSLLEAFIAASNQVQEFYDSDQRLSTEQAILDDNADGKGTPADWFVGTRATKSAKSGKADGLSANQVFLIQREGGLKLTDVQIRQRNDLEVKLEALRQRKQNLSEDDYYLRMEEIMLPLSKIYADQQ
jgi:hypothetical protein